LKVLLKHGANRRLKTNDGMIAYDLTKSEDLKNMISATNIELYDWLQKLDLGNCCKSLGDEEITVELLKKITDDELKDMGLKLGARKKILLNININSDQIVKEEEYLTNVEIGSSIGGGAFGSVFKGTWDGTTLIALKKLNAEELSKDFDSEVSILKDLHHPNIVGFLGIYLDREKKMSNIFVPNFYLKEVWIIYYEKWKFHYKTRFLLQWK